jgi:general secretion pathway protein A
MYYDFFGFREPPFSIAPDPRYLYLSERHKEALAHLMYGVKGQGGFIVITGEVGTGKTTISRCFIENAPDHADIALILNPRLSARELLSAICDELEIAHDIGASIKVLVDLINRDLLKAHAAGRHKVLMIDEAQNLSADVLEQLRLLTNLETAEKKLLQIVLLGQPELQQILALPELRQLNQRVTARYHLNAINKDELPAYLRYRLSVAGVRGDLFAPAAIQKLYRESHGIPRLINLISDRALLGAYAEGEHEITSAHVRQAAREVNGHLAGSPPAGTAGGSRRPGYLMFIASVLVAAIGVAWAIQNWSVDELPPVTPDEASLLQGQIERVDQSTPDSGPEPAAGSAGLPEETTPGNAPVFRFAEQAADLSSAFRQLFGVWGENYQPEQFPIACEFARKVDLGCLEKQGSRRSLEFIDRPAILRLQDDDGSQRYVVLRTLNGGMAEIVRPEGVQQVPFASLEPYWFGDYRVLWRLPEYQTDRSLYDDETGEQLWISSRMMELANKLGGSDSERARVKRMEARAQVRWYQELKGLTVDGIAGAMTVIQINNDLGTQVPRLLSSLPAGQG